MAAALSQASQSVLIIESCRQFHHWKHERQEKWREWEERWSRMKLLKRERRTEVDRDFTESMWVWCVLVLDGIVWWWVAGVARGDGRWWWWWWFDLESGGICRWGTWGKMSVKAAATTRKSIFNEKWEWESINEVQGHHHCVFINSVQLQHNFTATNLNL